MKLEARQLNEVVVSSHLSLVCWYPQEFLKFVGFYTQEKNNLLQHLTKETYGTAPKNGCTDKATRRKETNRGPPVENGLRLSTVL